MLHLHLPCVMSSQVQKLQHALFLKLLAFAPSYCPPFFVGLFFQITSPSCPFPLGHFLLCPRPITVPGPGFTCRCWSCSSRDTSCMCCSCAAGRAAGWCLIHARIHLFSVCVGGKSDSIKIYKTMLKKILKSSARASRHLLVV